VRDVGLRAQAAARVLRTMSTAKKNRSLREMAKAIFADRVRIEAANRKDLAADMPDAKKDRLRIDVDAVARCLRDIAGLPDPVGRVEKRRPRGRFRLFRVRVPIGVVLFIYEARPGVTAEAAALCLKSGNAAILKGGSEARHTNTALFAAMKGAIPDGAIQLVTGGHDEVSALLAMDDSIDLVIPRGGEGLIRAVSSQTKIPVLKHFQGNCHVYVDRRADLDMAFRVLENAKCQRPATCNAAEKVIVHADVAPSFVPRLAALNVELRGDSRARALLPMKAATDADWSEEYLDRILAVRIVNSLEEAIAHVERHGSHHTDAIVTRDRAAARRFLSEVDSATVLWNASTRLADGGVFGLGAEVGISTGKLHARGPMGLDEMTTYKWVVEGNGDLREP
jgi:glutamate-5-semialdehyde dehydrogenase